MEYVKLASDEYTKYFLAKQRNLENKSLDFSFPTTSDSAGTQIINSLQNYSDNYKKPISSESSLIDVYSDFRPKLNLIFSEEIREEIINNGHFRAFVKVLELAINNFLEINKINLNCKLLNEDDWEIESLRKKVLFLEFDSISFKLQMFYWREISNIIYSKIKTRFPDIRREFYIKLKII